MCGIAAVFSNAGVTDAEVSSVRRMIAAQQRRGPDHSGAVESPRFAVAHARLRISDLEPRSNQPFASDDGTVLLAFNGEIFNNGELRVALRDQGRSFRTTSDTETVLRLYEARGLDFVKELDGQFAVVIADERLGRLVICRDRFGVCPLYYATSRQRVFASSSFRALTSFTPDLVRTLDQDAIAQYMLMRFVLPPRTILKGIRQVRPAEILVFQDGGVKSSRYWSARGEVGSPIDDEHLFGLVSGSVRRNASAEVPVATFLSGGLDSSIVTSQAARVASPLSSVSIQFGRGECAEIAAAHEVAARAGSVLHVCHADDAVPDLNRTVDACLAAIDHPTGGRDAMAMFLLAKHLRRVRPDVKVVLTGTGADEIFNGYRTSYFEPSLGAGSLFEQCRAYAHQYSATTDRTRALLPRLTRVPLLEDNVASHVQAEIETLFPAVDSSDAGNVQNAFYVVTHLVGWELCLQDTMCMHHSLEPRVPFLARDVVEYAMQIHGASKCRGALEKMPLRRAFAASLPEDIVSRPKLPLSRPVAAWLMGRGFAAKYAARGGADFGIIDPAVLEELSRPEDFDLAWRVIVLQRWLETHVP